MKHHLRFLILKYASNPDSDDSVPFGILAYEVDTGSFAETRFLPTWKPVLHLDPAADLEVFAALKKEIEISWSNPKKRNDLLTMFLERFSNSVQVQEVSCVAESPSDEMETLASLHLRSSRE